LLVKAGCAQDWVGKVIQAVLEMAGIECPDEMSRQMVKHAILEGGIVRATVQSEEITQVQQGMIQRIYKGCIIHENILLT
jgi:hypothetical protein